MAEVTQAERIAAAVAAALTAVESEENEPEVEVRETSQESLSVSSKSGK